MMVNDGAQFGRRFPIRPENTTWCRSKLGTLQVAQLARRHVRPGRLAEKAIVSFTVARLLAVVRY